MSTNSAISNGYSVMRNKKMLFDRKEVKNAKNQAESSVFL